MEESIASTRTRCVPVFAKVTIEDFFRVPSGVRIIFPFVVRLSTPSFTQKAVTALLIGDLFGVEARTEHRIELRSSPRPPCGP